ncbi:MAG: hypothetical protein A3A51_00845 [Candidatus Levybacteria bacterium RIFCSPLOWO2_01_FULL_39_10]|nr:MAG: hypothetical protein A3A51_00845 [Candidatus Levybacteria bacterium RIFCSPLOWO2_01_FULL_39_10]
MPKISFVIVTYNSAGFISKLLKSIAEFHNNLSEIEIVIVDNSSTDGTVDKILNPKSETLNKSKITIIQNKENVGFAKGINIGAKKASGEFLLFINPDAVFEDGDIFEMTKVFESKIDAGLVGGKLLKENGEAEKSAGRFFGFPETLLLAFGLDEAFGARTSPEELSKVDFVSGGFMMVKKDLFERLGGFDENFFMYVEDMDLCRRAKDLGFATYFTPSVSLIHASHASSNRSFAIENIYKGIFYYQKKHNSLLSYKLSSAVLKLKANFLVIMGKILNNKYLADTYSRV